MLLLFSRYNSAILNNLNGIPIEKYGQVNKALSYDNCDMNANGELNVIKHLMPASNLVFDVGANVGEWSGHALKSNPAITIYAFEPIPEIYTILISNIASKSSEMQTYQLALANIDTRKDFYYYAKSIAISRMSTCYRRDSEVEKMIDFEPTKITVNVRSLDSFCHEHEISFIDFLKIDTEGSEFDILKGATGLLKNGSIRVIQFEYGGTYTSAGIKLHDVYMFLRDFGYQVFHIMPNKLVHITEWTDTLENFRYSNYLAVCSDLIN